MAVEAAELFVLVDQEDYEEVLRLLDKGVEGQQLVAVVPARGESVLVRMFTTFVTRYHPAIEAWRASCRRMISLVEGGDLLRPKNLLVCLVDRWQPELLRVAVDRCLLTPEFTQSERLKVLERVASISDWHGIALSLLEGLDTASFSMWPFLSRAIQYGNEELFAALAGMLSDTQLLEMNPSSPLLVKACGFLRWKTVELLLNRIPEGLLQTNDQGLGAIHSMIVIPPIDLWRRIVDGTPDGQFSTVLKGERKTILLRAAHDYDAEHVAALVARLYPPREEHRDLWQEARDLAERRASGRLFFSMGLDERNRVDQTAYRQEGEAIAEMLSVGRATKAAT
jgi:hypothetical protein